MEEDNQDDKNEFISQAPEWIPDNEVSECQACLRPFTLTFRRHHCRGCGKIFCKICSSQKCLLPGSFGFHGGPERVCDKCAKNYFPYESLMVATPNGGKIEFGRIGKGDEIILSFHGSLGSFSQGLALCYMLCDTPEMRDKYTVIALSRPGYGETPKEMGTSPQQQAEIAIQLLDELGIPRSKKIILIGVSAGGPAVIEFCLQYPKRVACSVFISCVTRKYWAGQGKGLDIDEYEENKTGLVSKIVLSSPTIQRAGFWLLQKLCTTYPSGTKTALRSLLTESSIFEPETIENHVERIIEDPENVWFLQTLIYSLGGYEGLHIDLDELKKLPDYAFEKITCPCLFIHGKNDGDVSINHSEHAYNRIANSTFISLENTDHIVWLSPYYKKTKQDLIDFISKYPSCNDDSINEDSVFAERPISQVIEQEEPISASPLAIKLHNSRLSKAMARLEKDEEEFYDL